MPLPDIAKESLSALEEKEKKAKEDSLIAMGEHFRAEKNEIIADYTNRLKVVLDQIAKAEEKRANIEEVFKSEYFRHISALERKKEEMRSWEEKLNIFARSLDQRERDLISSQSLIDKKIQEKEESLNQEVNRSCAILSDISSQREDINNKVKENQEILDDIKRNSVHLEKTFSEIKIARSEMEKASKKNEDQLNLIEHKTEQINLRSKSLEDLSKVLLQREDDISEKEKSLIAKRNENTQIFADISDKLAKVETINRDNESQLLIMGGITKQQNMMKVALAAKEISLNRKEQTLAEREQNIQNLEEEASKKL